MPKDNVSEPHSLLPQNRQTAGTASTDQLAVARSATAEADTSLGARLGDIDALFKGFADPTRLRILSALAAGPLCVSDLVEILRLPQPLTSRHLAYLRRVGLVEAERDTRHAHYRLAEPRSPVHANLLGCVRTCFVGIGTLDAERRVAAERAVEREASRPQRTRW